MLQQNSLENVLQRLRGLAEPENRVGLTQFGITGSKALGVRIPALRSLSREIGTDHDLALELYQHPLRETRLLAGMIADPKAVSESQADHWLRHFKDWELVDQTCFNLFWKTDWAYGKCFQWCQHQDEFEKRAAFALMAKLAVSDKLRPDSDFEAFYPEIHRAAADGRNFVTKAVDWSLRQIGKRNKNLLHSALAVARLLAASANRWERRVGLAALKEFRRKFPQEVVQTEES